MERTHTKSLQLGAKSKNKLLEMRDPGFGVVTEFGIWDKITVVTVVYMVKITVRLRSADRFRHLSDRDFTRFQSISINSINLHFMSLGLIRGVNRQ